MLSYFDAGVYMSADEQPANVTGLDRVVAKADNVHLTLMAGEDRIWLDMDPKTALNLAQTIADAVKQLQEPGVDPQAGVALYEAKEFTSKLDTQLRALGVEQKFVITAMGEGSTKITLRLSPEKAETFLAQMEMQRAKVMKKTQN